MNCQILIPTLDLVEIGASTTSVSDFEVTKTRNLINSMDKRVQPDKRSLSIVRFALSFRQVRGTSGLYGIPLPITHCYHGKLLNLGTGKPPVET